MTLKTTIDDGLQVLALDGRRSVLALTLFALVSFLPGFFSLPAIDRDEARYAQASRQMVETGDWIDIRLQQEPRYKKPIGIYWLQSAVITAFGEDGKAPIWMHRLPSLVGAVGAVLLTYWAASALVGRKAALLAGVMMAGSILLGIEARLAKTDAVLLATILLAQSIVARAYIRSCADHSGPLPAWRPLLYPALFWTAVAAGVLVKGPIIVLYVGLTIAALAVWQRSLAFARALRPLWGLAWCLALAAPWFVAIGLKTDWAFYETAIGYGVAGKITSGHEGHGAPPLTHAVWFWLVFWPGSALFALAVSGIWRRRREPWLRLLICWAVPSWIAFELITTKLPHYILPALPAIAIATAGILVSEPGPLRHRGVRAALAAAMVAMAVAGCAAVAVLAWMAAGREVAVVELAAVGCAAAVLAGSAHALRTRDLALLTASLFGGVIVFSWMLYPLLARVDSLWPAEQVAGIIDARGRCASPHIVTAGYEEPSLVFYTRTSLEMAGAKRAADVLAGGGCAIAIVEDSQRGVFEARARDGERAPVEIGRVVGYNLVKGQPLGLTVYESGAEGAGK